MNGLYNQAFHHLDAAFKKLSAQVPSPQKVSHFESFVFRYAEKTIQQAMVQKLARVVSGLHAAQLLLDNGLLQEQGAVLRMIDEFHEDIVFLAYAVIRSEETPLHKQYLDYFYEEEFDAPSAFESTQKRAMVKREKIRAYVSRIELKGADVCRISELSRTIHKGNSGFVHGASPHIMDMVGGIPPRFHIHGMSGTSRQEEHRRDLPNYFVRAINSFLFVAMAFGDEELFQLLREFRLEFEKLSREG